MNKFYVRARNGQAVHCPDAQVFSHDVCGTRFGFAVHTCPDTGDIDISLFNSGATVLRVTRHDDQMAFNDRVPAAIHVLEKVIQETGAARTLHEFDSRERARREPTEVLANHLLGGE